jgi:hypothetical protein
MLFQSALSLPVGATSLTQLPPDSRLLLLLALIWSPRASEMKNKIAQTGANRSGRRRGNVK